MAAVPKSCAKGRCAGCGMQGPLRAVQKHVAGCEAYSALWVTDKMRCLDPGPELVRWLAAEGSPEARLDAQTDRVTTIFARRDAAAQKYNARWATPPDPLGELG